MLTRKMKHTPHPSRRSVIAEIEERFLEHVDATAGHQFRHPDDISLLTSLQQYYAYLTGRAVPGTIGFRYADLAAPVTPFKLGEMLRHRNIDAFCLNDTDSEPEVVADQEAMLADFLPAYLPFVSPYELSPWNGPVTALPPAPPSLPGRQVGRRPMPAIAGARPAWPGRGSDEPTATHPPGV